MHVQSVVATYQPFTERDLRYARNRQGAYLQCGGNELLSTDENPLTHPIIISKHSGGRSMNEKVLRILVINVMRCAMSEETPN